MNYFSSLNLRQQLEQLGHAHFMDSSDFDGIDAVKDLKVVIVGCGAQGLHQGLNLRDSGLNVTFALRKQEIEEKQISWKNASENDFKFASIEEAVPKGDLVLNLTPDKYHTPVVSMVEPLMKKGAVLSYSHGFNIVEEGKKIREDITVIMVAPKAPGSEVRAEYLRGFGVPALIAVHKENDPEGKGLEIAKAYAVAIGSDRAGVLHSSFVAEVKSDLMGEQTILCGMLQTGSILCFDKLVADGIEADYAAKLIQNGWETITESMKHGGITAMMDRLSNPDKIKTFQTTLELKKVLKPLFEKHMDDILSGEFSENMMKDWADGDKKLLGWREATNKTGFEKAEATSEKIDEQDFYDKALIMVAMVKAGVELAYETMVASGIQPESAYYESLHETPLIANLIARKKLYEMNKVISDTAEYGNYLFSNAAVPLLEPYIENLEDGLLGKSTAKSTQVDNRTIIMVNDAIRNHEIELVGEELRSFMDNMKSIALGE